MVGFPGETEQDFEQTCTTFLEGPYAYCHVFTYSEREGTPAAKSCEHVPMENAEEEVPICAGFRRRNEWTFMPAIWVGK
jgi:tRNA A37 methylthiotransferase MiaB